MEFLTTNSLYFAGPPAPTPSLRPIECQPIEPKPMDLSQPTLWGIA